MALQVNSANDKMPKINKNPKNKLEMLDLINVHLWRWEMQDMQHLLLPANQRVMIRRVSLGDRKALILTLNSETLKETQGIKNCNMGIHTLPFL